MPSAISTGKALLVVSNTTPLSELAKLGRAELLRDVYGQLTIPPEVLNELTASTHPAIQVVTTAKWLTVHPVSNQSGILSLRRSQQLGLGECAAIVLAEELGADRLLLDDWLARREAQARKLPIVGTVGILLVAKKLGLLANAKDPLNELLAQGMYISSKLYQDALALAGE